MLFMAPAVSWKSVVVSRVNMQTLFIIIIIIIINHPPSDVPGPSVAPSHWPGHTLVALKWERRKEGEQVKNVRKKRKEQGKQKGS